MTVNERGYVATSIRQTTFKGQRMRVVRPERFELPASWFVARRSIQLSYGRKGREYYHNDCRSPFPRTAPARGATEDNDRTKSTTCRKSQLRGSTKRQRGPKAHRSGTHCGGEGGIRTLEGLLTLTPLAGARLRPLGHLSGSSLSGLSRSAG